MAKTKVTPKMKKLIALVGDADCGKTFTLVEVARQLAEKGKFQTDIIGLGGSFKSRIKPDGNPSDIRIVIPNINGEYIYIATAGDTKEDLVKNFEFFDALQVSPLRRYFFVEKDYLRQISWTELRKYPPTVCITACRPKLLNWVTTYFAKFVNLPHICVQKTKSASLSLKPTKSDIACVKQIISLI